MIGALRKKSEGFFVKFILGIITLGFVVVGGMSYIGSGSMVVFSAAGEKVSAPLLDQELKRQLVQMERISGQKINLKLAVQMGFVNQVISNLSFRMLLDKEAKNLGIVIRKERIEDMIRAYPELLDTAGNFSYNVFQAFLAASNITERQFIEETQKEKARDLLQSSLVNVPNVPNFLAKFNYMTNNETRNISYILIKPEQSVMVDKPTDNDLKELFETRKAFFKTPEYRYVSYVVISPDKVAANNKIDKKNSDKLYKALYDTAENIIDDLIGGESFAEINKKYGMKVVDVPKFDITGKGVKSAAVTDKVFTDAFVNKALSMSNGEVSGVEEVGENLIIFKINNVEEAKALSFDDVKNELVDIWNNQKKEQKTLERISSIKREIMEGKKSLNEVGSSYGLTVGHYEVKQGTDSLPADTVRAVFDSKIGNVNIKKEGSLYRVFVVDKVIYPIKDKNDYEVEKDALRSEIRLATLEGYVFYLRSKYGFSVNQNNYNAFVNSYN